MDIRELLRHIRNTPRDHGVQRETGVDRRTVKQYGNGPKNTGC